MLAAFLKAENPAFLATYTRNPAILRMLASVCGRNNVFPFSADSSLKKLAQEMPHASLEAVDSMQPVYHHERYGTGLYPPDNDPAFQRIGRNGQTLAQTYPALVHPGTALVVTAKARNKVK